MNMTNKPKGFICLTMAMIVLMLLSPTKATTADRILVIYNASLTQDQDADGTNDSKQVAEYYITKRGVPTDNLLGLTITLGQYYNTADYAKFQSEVVQPIKTKLTALGEANIDVILLCYGMPYLVKGGSGYAADKNICIDNVLMALNYWNPATNNIGWNTNPYFATRPSFETDKPHFTHASYKFAGTEMYLVARLDGPSANRAMSLLDEALYGERYITAGAGYYNGVVYVDSRYAAYTDSALTADADVISGNYGSYGAADKNMAYGEHYVIGTGLTCKWEQTDATIGSYGLTFTDGTSAATAPRALFYEGWYSNNATAFEWLPGSIACHLHSMSFASGMTGAFCGYSLSHGASCVSGTVGEPYLNGHQRPNILLYYILKGYNFAEASMLATPSVGWMPMNVGDPLYTPMRAKTPVTDMQFPAVASSYPTVTGSLTSGTRNVIIRLRDTPAPEVARIEVQYGLTTAYGITATSGPGYYSMAAITLAGLQGNSTYHYCLTLTDPVGNVTITSDYTFTTGAVTNTAPVAYDQTVVAGPEVVKDITLSATDAQGNALTYAQVTGPWHGAVTIVGSKAAYLPNSGYSGPDSFTFKANDGALESNTALVSITVMSTAEVTIVLQQGLNGYSGAKDAMISGYSGEDTWNWGGAATMHLYSQGSRSCAVAFDLASSIPSGAIISNAILDLYATSAGTDQPMRLYKMTHTWVEGTGIYHQPVDGVTYYTYDGVNNWTTNGGDFDTTVVAQLVSNDVGSRWLEWNIRDLTQSWISVPASNHGMLLRLGIYKEGYILSKENSDTALRPKLTVSYFPEPTTKQEGTYAIIDMLSIGSAPNPFNPSTMITYALPPAKSAIYSIFNTRGQKVKELHLAAHANGVRNRFSWDGRNSAGKTLSSGVYFGLLELQDGKRSEHTMLLLK
ncbi:MAG: hypothetical protein A2519_22065 [Candidatus Raymondbacteria bacterium RIFOXYD12_FULL_49_13]|uniref:FlgD Ig-like domain-containing protein n=1 Tax=Candidatus Raymondbacteria bacterium RIFOXYD12_FULL_49_13 TaxID=1817890 RepID=A0A1F7F0G2_UNCRA|nr:MAG: hypothetical protein A2519_22065 [Candidatus Raymondbacteria bacterium RIFOXYD12_FULL_49_13]